MSSSKGLIVLIAILTACTKQSIEDRVKELPKAFKPRGMELETLKDAIEKESDPEKRIELKGNMESLLGQIRREIESGVYKLSDEEKSGAIGALDARRKRKDAENRESIISEDDQKRLLGDLVFNFADYLSVPAPEKVEVSQELLAILKDRWTTEKFKNRAELLIAAGKELNQLPPSEDRTIGFRKYKMSIGELLMAVEDDKKKDQWPFLIR